MTQDAAPADSVPDISSHYLNLRPNSFSGGAPSVQVMDPARASPPRGPYIYLLIKNAHPLTQEKRKRSNQLRAAVCGAEGSCSHLVRVRHNINSVSVICLLMYDGIYGGRDGWIWAPLREPNA